MEIEGAIVKEQGVTFGIVIVKPSAISTNTQADNTRRAFQHLFPGMPLILMAQDSRGIPTYQGRKDIVKFLANIDFRRIPWKRYTVSN